MNKQQLAAKIWESANKMRSKIEANEYKDYILGFIFYKFLSDKEVEYLKKTDWTDKDIEQYLTEDDAKTVENIQMNIGYFISYENLFSTWLKKGKDFDVSNVRDALSAFSRLISATHKKVFDKIFDTLQTGLSKLGDGSGSQTKAISDLLQLIKDIPMNGKQDYDVLGFIYEYLISNFAANAGKKAGEFYTPHEVSLLMSEIVANHLKTKDKIEIYDPTSGSGSLLINIGRSVAKHMTDKNNIKYYAQELKENTYNLTRMNLVMRGILPDNIVTRCGDTLEEDWPYFDENDKNRTYNPLYVDAVVSNPPYSQNWEPANKDSDPRYSRFGLAPKSKADYAFLLHDLYHVKPSGIMTIVLPHGVLFRGGEEETIRKNLIEQNHIDAIIGLPANIFFGTGIPTIIMVLKQKRPNTDVLIIDASKGFTKVGKNNKLQASDIKKIVDTVVSRESAEKYAKKVERDEIRKNGYNLNIPRYVDSSQKAESWDIYATMFGGIPYKEINELEDDWQEFASLKDELFRSNGTPYASLAVEDINTAITNNRDVKAFAETFKAKFADFGKVLEEKLIDNMNTLVVTSEENAISENIFARLTFTKLIDKYKAYQLLDDHWNGIETDLEMIQTEGFAAVKQVDPNMVIKKKNGKDEEVQEGYIGHIIPFDLIQSTMLKAESDELKAKEARLAEIQTEYSEILENLTEEDKEEYKECFNEDGDSYVSAEVAKQAKILAKDKKQYGEDTIEWKLIKVNALFEKERELKKQVRTDTEQLHAKTKATIEGLTDSQALELLKQKWIAPLVVGFAELPSKVIADLTAKVKTLAEKYKTTLLDTETEIKEAEKELCTMIEDLTGDEFDMKGLKELQELLCGGKQ